MNWNKVLLAGLVGGVVMWLVNFLLYGVILGGTHASYEIFRRDANPVMFLFVGVCMAVVSAILFAKTRSSWGQGLAGGATFGFYLGLVGAFAQFLNVLIFQGFPYFLSWCWAGSTLIATVVLGAVLGLVYKE